MRGTIYDAKEGNITKMWEVSSNRTYHLKNLQTIYQERKALKMKAEHESAKRQKNISSYHRNREADIQRKNHSFQDKVNYENSLLRNKLIAIMDKKKKQASSPQMDRNNPYKDNKFVQIYQNNLKMSQRLCNVKSHIISKQEIEENSRKLESDMERIQKKSPKKKAYMKTLMKKKNYDSWLPQISDDFCPEK